MWSFSYVYTTIKRSERNLVHYNINLQQPKNEITNDETEEGRMRARTDLLQQQKSWPNAMLRNEQKYNKKSLLVPSSRE